MRKKWWLFLVVPPALVLFGWLFGELIMHLWNWLLPGLFGWKQITFWQGLGLLLLSRILVGGWGSNGSGKGPRFKRRKAERWAAMTPEEREQFRQRMRDRGGCFGEPATEGKEPS